MGEETANNNSDDSRRGETRSAAAVAVGILLSKLVGLLRQRVTAYYFGTSDTADVLSAAFRIGNLAQNLLGEGTLSATFIPVYAKLRAEGKDDEATAFAHASLGLLSACVLVVSAIGVAVAPWLSLLVAGGFGPQKLAMTTELVRWLFPMTGLLVLCAWGLGVLNAHRSFFLPYAAPVVWSAAQIAALLIGGGWLLLSGQALAKVLALGALLGAGCELLVLLRKAGQLLGGLRPTLAHRLASVRTAAKRLPNVILGRGVIQISGLVDTLLVSFLGSGANSTFGYAQMLYLLPMSLLGTGEAAVALPAMARDTAETSEERRHQKMRARMGQTLSRIAVLSLPAMVVLIFFGEELINVLLRTGRFDASSTRRVASLLRLYGFALVANASVRLLATTFFALGETKIPARLAVVRVVVSTALAVALMKPLGVAGVVLGAVVAGWLEAILLGGSLRRRLGGLGLEHVPYAKLLVVGLLTWLAPWLLKGSLGVQSQSWLGSFLILSAAGAAFVLSAVGSGVFNLRRLLRRG